MQLGCATFVQPNLSFSTKGNYSIMMEGKTWKFLFEQTNWHLINMQARPWYLISILSLLNDK